MFILNFVCSWESLGLLAVHNLFLIEINCCFIINNWLHLFPPMIMVLKKDRIDVGIEYRNEYIHKGC